MPVLMSIRFWDRKVICTTVAAANHDLKLSVPFLTTFLNSESWHTSCWCGQICTPIYIHCENWICDKRRIVN